MRAIVELDHCLPIRAKGSIGEMIIPVWKVIALQEGANLMVVGSNPSAGRIVFS